LCEINQASLHYRPTPHGGGCFRINFSHHQRMF
jgi:two-component system, NtrC family, sensor histidine kinase PilS